MPTYSQAGQFGPAAISGAPRGVPLRVVDAAGSDAVLYRDASKNVVVGPIVYSTDAGNVSFFADPGTYTVRWSGGGSAQVTITGGIQESPGAFSSMITPDLVDEGQEVYPRLFASSSNPLTSGVAVLSYFYARKTETVTRLRSLTTGTAASGLTYAALGVYSMDAGGAATLIGATASDPTLFGAQFTIYTRNVVTPFPVVRGQRYGFAHLVIGTTPPSVCCVASNGHYIGLAPKMAGEWGGRTELPAFITEVAQSPTGRLLQGFLLP